MSRYKSNKKTDVITISRAHWDANAFGLEKTTVSNNIRSVAIVIFNQLGVIHTRLPKTEVEVEHHERKFHKRYKSSICIQGA